MTGLVFVETRSIAMTRLSWDGCGTNVAQLSRTNHIDDHHFFRWYHWIGTLIFPSGDSSMIKDSVESHKLGPADHWQLGGEADWLVPWQLK